MRRASESVKRVSDVRAGLQRFHIQYVDWEPCAPRWAIVSGVGSSSLEARHAAASFQCTRQAMPLDCANPGGATIKQAISRLHAGDPAQRSTFSRQCHPPDRCGLDAGGHL